MGDWSEATNGLRGRLLLAERKSEAEGVRWGLVYLELQNLSSGDTLYVYYDVSKTPLKCELRDAAGKIVESSSGPGSEFMPSACWLSFAA